MPLPPERYHAFVSYTTREDEVREVKPLVDYFLYRVLGPALERELHEVPVFYDGYSLYELRGGHIPEATLKGVLTYAIEESEILLALMSPQYLDSTWCRLEYVTMGIKRPRPWFDRPRSPPIEVLERDRPRRKAGMWEAIRTARLRARWDPSAAPRLGGPIVPIVWKGELDLVEHLPFVAGQRVFDWRDCAEAAGALLADSSAPQASLEYAMGELRVLHDTAETVVSLLRRRRLAYGAEGRERA